MANEINSVAGGAGKVSVVSDSVPTTTPYPVAAEVFRWGAGVVDSSGQSTSRFAPSPGMVRPDQSYLVGPEGGVPKPPTGVGYSPGQYMEEFQKNFPEEYKKMKEAQAQQALLAKPPSFDDMNSMLDEKNLVDGKLSEVSASRMLNASHEDKLKMLESWGMKPKHTNKDPAQVDALFSQVVSEMRQGPHEPKDYRVRFAGKKFRLHIKRDPVTGKLTAAFKRKKPGFFKSLLKGISKITGGIFKAFEMFSPIAWGVKAISSVAGMAKGAMSTVAGFLK